MGLNPNWIPPGWVEPNLGPGISRPKADERTQSFVLRVKQPNMPTMRISIPAPTKAKAITYCKNRWPDCTVEVIQ